MGGGWSPPRPRRFNHRVRNPVPIIQEAGWAPGQVWTREENLAPPTEIRSLDHPLQSSRKRNSHQTVPCPLTCRGVTNQCKGLEASHGSRKSSLVRRVHGGRHGSLHQKLLNPDGSFRTTGSP